jgi:feruloyl-CoA synthase
VLGEPPSIADGEITAKGNLNFRKILSRRAKLLERLYNDSDRATILA